MAVCRLLFLSNIRHIHPDHQFLHTFLYLCDTADKTKKKNSDVLLWLNLDEILDSIVFREYDDVKLIYRQALDKELIREYLKLLKIIR